MRYRIIMLLFLPCFAFSQVKTEKPSSPKKELIWAEEFNYNGLPDKTKWSYEEGFVRSKEPQYYTQNRLKNARVKNGNLIITARKEDFEGGKYTSASINTWGKFEVTKGCIEVRAKLPTGDGAWPAIWTLGVNRKEVRWPKCGEIDIMEYWANNKSDIHANVHTGDYNHTIGKGRGGKIVYDQPWKDFHVFAVEWYDDRLDFFMDDSLYYTCHKKGEGIGEWPFDAPQYILLNLALNKDPTKIDDSIFPIKYLVDYVRVYKLED